MHLPEIFLIGGLWFWLLLAAETILLLVLLEWRKGTLATLTFLVTLLLLQSLGDVNLFGYAIAHPWTVVVGAVVYFVLGTGWAVVKWWFYVRKQRAWYDELRAAFLRLHGLDPRSALPEELQATWQRCLERARKSGRPLEVRPLAARHKAYIVHWMAYWPWSLTWTLLKDPVRQACLTIYHSLAEYLQEMSDRAFRGVEADLPPAAEVPLAQRIDPVLVEFGIDSTMFEAEHV